MGVPCIVCLSNEMLEPHLARQMNNFPKTCKLLQILRWLCALYFFSKTVPTYRL